MAFCSTTSDRGTLLRRPRCQRVTYPALLAVCRETRNAFLDQGETTIQGEEVPVIQDILRVALEMYRCSSSAWALSFGPAVLLHL
jgi:hypothetical protein